MACARLASALEGQGLDQETGVVNLLEVGLQFLQQFGGFIEGSRRALVQQNLGSRQLVVRGNVAPRGWGWLEGG